MPSLSAAGAQAHGGAMSSPAAGAAAGVTAPGAAGAGGDDAGEPSYHKRRGNLGRVPGRQHKVEPQSVIILCCDKGSKGKRALEQAALSRVEPLRRAINPQSSRILALPVMSAAVRDLATHSDPRSEAAVLSVIGKYPRSRNELLELRQKLITFRGVLCFVFCSMDNDVVCVAVPP